MAGSRVVRPTKEAFYVRVEASDGIIAFYNATEHVGKTMPFSKPRATCAMRVSPDAVSFSLLHLTNKNAAVIAAKPVTLPRGPLSRLERRAISYAPMAADRVVVELSSQPAEDSVSRDAVSDDAAAQNGLDNLFVSEDAAPESGLNDLFAEDAKSTEAVVVSDKTGRRPMKPAVVETFECTIRRDENGVARLEAVGEEHVFELPRGAVHVSLYLASPVASIKRTLAIGFIGHVGKPGTNETVTRVASMVLNSLSHLPDFRILGGIETCVVPASPGRGGASKTAAKRASDKVAFPVHVYLFDEQTAMVASGYVGVDIDLENANPSTGKLLFVFTPEKSLESVFDRYRGVVERAVTDSLFANIGEDVLSNIVYDVVLGSVSAATIDDLKSFGKSIPAFDLTPAQFRVHA